MKKILWILLSGIFVLSCTKSPEEKANALIKEDMKKILYHVDTYDPVETLVDSAFTPFDSPEFYEKTVQLAAIGTSVEEYKREMSDAKSTMAIWGGSYQTVFGKERCKEAQDKYDENEEKLNHDMNKGKKLVHELRDMMAKENQFIGFKAFHRFRVQNNSGQIVFGQMKYLFDKDMSKIVAAYDMDEEKYQTAQALFQEMRDGGILSDSNDSDNEESLSE